MTALNNLPDAIQWSEGMLLSPQHFQQNDEYWHQQLRHRLKALTPHYWGVLQLQCKLIKDIVSIDKLECILPDGLLVEFPGRYARVPAGALELDVGSQCKTGAAPQRIWLLVNARGANAACQDSKERRYNSVIDTRIIDENTGQSGQPIARLQVEFQLYLGARSPSAECAVPLCEVVRAANEQLTITSYHPPLLKMDGCGFQGERSLFKKLNQLHDVLWGSAQKLALHCHRGSDDQRLDAENYERLQVARSLSKCLPPLSILLSPHTHPHALYEAIAEIVGQVSSIGSNPLPLLMKPYQHDDCMPQFQAAFDYIDAQLAQVDMSRESLSFRRVDHDLKGPTASFERRLLPGMNDQLIIELTPDKDQTHAQLLQWLTESFVAEEALIPALRRARLAGAKVRALTKQEIQHHKLKPQAALFALHNQRLSFGEGHSVHAFAEEQMLVILGKNNALTPAAITLHYQKSAPPTSAQSTLGGKHE